MREELADDCFAAAKSIRWGRVEVTNAGVERGLEKSQRGALA